MPAGGEPRTRLNKLKLCRGARAGVDVDGSSGAVNSSTGSQLRDAGEGRVEIATMV